jgi:hypothetical protein
MLAWLHKSQWRSQSSGSDQHPTFHLTVAANSTDDNDPGRTRTCNPRLRRPMPYPLGHGADENAYGQCRTTRRKLFQRFVAPTARRETEPEAPAESQLEMLPCFPALTTQTLTSITHSTPKRRAKIARAICLLRLPLCQPGGATARERKQHECPHRLKAPKKTGWVGAEPLGTSHPFGAALPKAGPNVIRAVDRTAWAVSLSTQERAASRHFAMAGATGTIPVPPVAPWSKTRPHAFRPTFGGRGCGGPSAVGTEPPMRCSLPARRRSPAKKSKPKPNWAIELAKRANFPRTTRAV